MCLVITVLFLDSVAFKNAAAMWILKTRENHQIPISVMNSIISDVQSLFELGLNDLKDDVKQVMDQAGISNETIGAVQMRISGSTHAKIFQGLETQAQQLTYFQQNLNLVVCFSLIIYVMIYSPLVI